MLSVPTPSYKDITFSPPLSPNKQIYVSNTTLGYYSKMILLWDKPWWKGGGYCGKSQSFIGPASVTRDTSDELLGQFSLTCFINGEPGREWSKLSPKDRKEAVLFQPVEIFGAESEKVIREPTEVFEQEWANEVWSRGCPCPFTKPGTMGKVGKALRERFGRVHFVGTETSWEWKGYMEGAVRSGERSAEEVVQELRDKEKVKLPKF